MSKIGNSILESINVEPKNKEIKKLTEDVDTVHRVKDCHDDVDLIMALEGDTLMIEDMDDWNRVLELAKDFSRSQGFYGRLARDMIEMEESEGISFPVYM